MRKKIEFRVLPNEKPIVIVRILCRYLNVRYSHHYFLNGKYLLEYYDL